MRVMTWPAQSISPYHASLYASERGALLAIPRNIIRHLLVEVLAVAAQVETERKDLPQRLASSFVIFKR